MLKLCTIILNGFVHNMFYYQDKLKQKAPKETDTSIMPGVDVKIQVLFSKVCYPLYIV